jgi:hypothetical protein
MADERNDAVLSSAAFRIPGDGESSASAQVSTMLDYGIVLLVGFIALSGGGWWVIVVGAVGLSLTAWHALWLLGTKYPNVQLDWNVLLHFLQVWVIGLVAASVAYLGGALVRNMLGLE